MRGFWRRRDWRYIALPVFLILGLVFVASVSGANSMQNGRIAFTKVVDSNEVWSMRSNGTDKVRLIGGPGSVIQAVASRNGKQLAFVSNRDGDSEIFVSSANGGSIVQLTQNDARDLDPAWSPNGKRIVFASNRGGTLQIYSMAANGSDVKQVTSRPGDYRYPDWSSTGQIVFSGGKGGSEDILTMRADGTKIKRLTTSGSRENEPAWSPDGKKIAYTRGGGNIWVMSNAGAHRHYVVWGSEPQWSRDGKRLAYVSYWEDLSIFVVRADGRNVQLVAEYGVHPSWLGTRLLYTRFDLQNYDIATIDHNGLGEQRLTTSPPYDGHPSWSADGTSIVFSSDRGGEEGLYTMDVNGESLRQLFEIPTSWAWAVWSPDGTKIAFDSEFDDTYTFSLSIYDVTTGKVQKLETFGDAMMPAWAPDGRHLAFCSDRGMTTDLYTIDTVDGSLRRLTNTHDVYEWHPAWSPDGKMIAYTAYAGGNAEIWSMTDKGELRQSLTSGDAVDDNPAWSPDGQLIAFDRRVPDSEAAIYTMHADGSRETRVTVGDPATQPSWQPVPMP